MNHYVTDSYGSLPRKMIAWRSPKSVCVGGYSYGGPQLSLRSKRFQSSYWANNSDNCHGKTKNPTAKTKSLTEKPKTSRQKQKPHSKTKNLTAKPKTSRQNQILHSKNQIPHGKSKYPRHWTKAILFLLWSIWFCRKVFGFAVRYFVLVAVRFLVLPWGILFSP